MTLATTLGLLLLAAVPPAAPPVATAPDSWEGPVLITFSQANCAPCKQQYAAIKELQQEGWRVGVYRIDQAQTWQPAFPVKSTPTTILYVDGVESQRWVGPQDAETFRGPLWHADMACAVKKLGPEAPKLAAPAPPVPEPRERPAAGPCPFVVRVQRGGSWGSGVLVAAEDGNAWALTAFHVLRDETGEIRVHVWKDGKFKAYAAELEDSNPLWDVACLRLADPGVGVARKAARPPAAGEAVAAFGWGGKPDVYRKTAGKVTKFLAPAPSSESFLLEFTAETRSGDSGGPIVNAQGDLVGLVLARQQTAVGLDLLRVRPRLPWLTPWLRRREKLILLVPGQTPAEALVAVGRTWPGVKLFAAAQPHATLTASAQQCADAQARSRSCGHPGWNQRFQSLIQEFGYKSTPREIAAMSWRDRSSNDLEAMSAQMYESWRQSPGHWRVLATEHRLYGAAMAQDNRGAWYAAIVVVD